MKTTKEHFNQTYLENNVIRWVSNDTVPPLEILTELFVSGYITREIHFDSLATRKIEDLAFLEQYVANRQKYGYSDEEKFEMRAAFGDEEVVDVFTGKVVAFN
jgi:hypothetical protein